MAALVAEVVYDYSTRNAPKSMKWSGIITLKLEGSTEPFMQFECRLISGKNGDFIGFPDRQYENAQGETKYHKVMGPTFDREEGKPTPTGEAFQNLILKAVHDHLEAQASNGPVDDADIPF